ncbi:glycosyltransferase family 4 protein [archaeon]|nr:glycosyltransferase family 4 protein [archaeon]
MQICMLSELFYPYMLGGAERRYYEIARRLARKHEVTVYSLNLFGKKSSEIRENIEIRRVGFNHPMNKRSLITLPSYFTALIRSLNSEYDIIDANQGIASFSSVLKPLTKRPIVATFHDIYWNQWGKHFRLPYSGIGKTMEFIWSKTKYDAIIANSPETAKKLAGLGFGHDIEMIPSGLDTNLIDIIKVTKNKNTVVYVGRLEKYKNVSSVLYAIARVKKSIPDIKLKVIGSGSEGTNLRNLAKKLSINVEFFGFVDERKKFEIIKSSNVLINPSFVEGLGLIALEAMACGCPVVVRDLDCYFFCSKSNSITYSDENKLPDIIIGLLRNPEKCKALSKNALETARHFTWDETARHVERMYKSCVLR